jgi:hypothetical protein
LFDGMSRVEQPSMPNTKSLSILLGTLLPLALAPGCSSDKLSTQGQLITCTTDPSTGVITRCEPGDGSGSGSGGSGTCTDIDEDGDGEAHDQVADDSGHHGTAGDEDGDGIGDDEDCDNHPGEDDDNDDGLPYDIRPELGQSTRPIVDAFAAQGAQPAEIVSVTGATWRLAELQAGTAFTVTADDCNHAGNRDVGRDRVIVTWKLADASVHSDHLDIRYCK